ncbi:porin family protein [Ignatzschineria rhizosphaerae]|uniref:Porin family protein n=1 Tax=Ignatzschineria rhizosphaerae TaxID=2923279 RepID=A0ABY3WZJ1_9GAMM|nr:outer membrane protein [Ignatzschineria rhizosphaerae]UNM95450.1 porin family protein [Ignatzschineria rhizosphaerae]
MKIRALLASMLLLGAVSSAQAEITKGFYAGVNLIGAKQKAKDMDDSIHAAGGQFEKHKDNKSFVTGSIAGGYKFDDIFRVELEYVIPKKNEFTSSFGTDFNTHKIKSQRLMVNAYASYPINDDFSVYGSAGLGYARLTSKGAHNNGLSHYRSATDNNFAWSLGAGVSYKPVDNTYIDLGFRHVDMGKAKTGVKNNGDQLRAKLSSNEVTLGVRYMLGEWYTEDKNPVLPTDNIYADHVTPELRESFEKADPESGSFRESHAAQPLKKADGTSVPREVKVIDWRQHPY